MGYITLNEAKAHLNVDANMTEDDNYITSLLDLVEIVVENHIHDTLTNLEDINNNIPKPLIHAMKVLIAHFYENREPVLIGASVITMPYTLEYLLDPYVNRTIS